MRWAPRTVAASLLVNAGTFRARYAAIEPSQPTEVAMCTVSATLRIAGVIIGENRL